MEGGQEQTGRAAHESPDLGATLGRFFEEMEERFGVGCRFTMDALGGSLNEAQERGLDRLIREGVSNALLHSGAFRIEVSLRLLQGQVVARVEDDGRGISQEELDASEKGGLQEMRELLHDLGGELEIRGIPGDGTALVMRFPLAPGREPGNG